MDIQKIDEFSLALLEFVKHASREGASKEEVEALPLVSEVLMLLAEKWGGGWPKD